MKKIVITIFVLLGVILFVRFALGGPEDIWICQNGEWTKHGNPGTPSPTKPCGGFISSCLELSSNKAIQLLSNEKEVIEYQKLIKENGGKVTYGVAKTTGPEWTIQVAEDLTDHLATFNWYEVDKCTGKITKIFNGKE